MRKQVKDNRNGQYKHLSFKKQSPKFPNYLSRGLYLCEHREPRSRRWDKPYKRYYSYSVRVPEPLNLCYLVMSVLYIKLCSRC